MALTDCASGRSKSPAMRVQLRVGRRRQGWRLGDAPSLAQSADSQRTSTCTRRLADQAVLAEYFAPVGASCCRSVRRGGNSAVSAGVPWVILLEWRSTRHACFLRTDQCNSEDRAPGFAHMRSIPRRCMSSFQRRPPSWRQRNAERTPASNRLRTISALRGFAGAGRCRSP